MSQWLILFIAAIYLVTAADLFLHEKAAMAGVFLGYSASNVFLWLAAR